MTALIILYANIGASIIIIIIIINNVRICVELNFGVSH